MHDFSSLIRSRDTDDHICHCMSIQKVHRSIVKMMVKFKLITVRSTTLDVFYCDFLYLIPKCFSEFLFNLKENLNLDHELKRLTIPFEIKHSVHNIRM